MSLRPNFESMVAKVFFTGVRRQKRQKKTYKMTKGAKRGLGEDESSLLNTLPPCQETCKHQFHLFSIIYSVHIVLKLHLLQSRGCLTLIS